MVEEVKESVPLALKKPLMESAWATAAQPMANIESATRRFIIRESPRFRKSSLFFRERDVLLKAFPLFGLPSLIT
jgi:hypothetical protein